MFGTTAWKELIVTIVLVFFQRWNPRAWECSCEGDCLEMIGVRAFEFLVTYLKLLGKTLCQFSSDVRKLLIHKQNLYSCDDNKKCQPEIRPYPDLDLLKFQKWLQIPFLKPRKGEGTSWPHPSKFSRVTLWDTSEDFSTCIDSRSMIHALDKQAMIRLGFDPSEILQNLPDHRNLQ